MLGLAEGNTISQYHLMPLLRRISALSMRLYYTTCILFSLLKVTSRLFDIMSGHSRIDHPLCEECTDTLLDQLDQQLKITDDELKDYNVFFNKLNEKPSVDTDALSKELAELRKEEEELVRQLEEVEKEREKVAEKMEIENERSKQLAIEEKKYWTEYSEYQKELLEYQDEQQRFVHPVL